MDYLVFISRGSFLIYFSVEALQVRGHFRRCTVVMSMSYSLVVLAKNVKHKVIWGWYELIKG